MAGEFGRILGMQIGFRGSELESFAVEGNSPVLEKVDLLLGRYPKYSGARETLLESGRTTS